MKKRFCVFIALCLVLIVTACTVSEPPPTTGVGSAALGEPGIVIGEIVEPDFAAEIVFIEPPEIIHNTAEIIAVEPFAAFDYDALSAEMVVEVSAPLVRILGESTTISAGGLHTVGLRTDGSVVATRVYYSDTSRQHEGNRGQSEVSDWRDIVAVSAGLLHTVGLRADGTVVATRVSDAQSDFGQSNVEGWRDIVAISTGELYTIGLRSDGTVVHTGLDENNKWHDISGWRDIVAISACEQIAGGLRADGTVVVTSGHFPDLPSQSDVSEWRNIVEVSAGFHHFVGLRADGTVMAVGANWNGQQDVSGWRDIVAVSAGMWHTFGLRVDGTVVAAGGENSGDGSLSFRDINGWSEIVAISTGMMHVVGLRVDGTVVTAGDTTNGQGGASTWQDIRVPNVTPPTPTLTPDVTNLLVGNWRRDNPDSAWHNVIVNVSEGGTQGIITNTEGSSISVERVGDAKWRSIIRESDNSFTLLDFGLLNEGGGWFEMQARIEPNGDVMYISGADGTAVLPGHTQRWVRVGS